MSGRISPVILGKGRRFPGIGAVPTFWSLMVGLGIVMFSLLVCYSECILRLKI